MHIRYLPLALCLFGTGCFREAAPCTPEDYDELSASCDDCAVEIEDRRRLCEKQIREDAE
jgi:hypothetical protein